MSSKFYTNVSEVDGKIFHRYIEDGVAKSEVVSVYPYKLYTESPYGTADMKSLFGKRLDEHSFDTIKEMKAFGYKHNDVHGNKSATQQFIVGEYPDGAECENHTLYNILNFDLEVWHDNGFPDPDESLYEILSVSFDVVGKTKPFTYGLKPYTNENTVFTYQQFDSEGEMLAAFVKQWVKINPVAYTGWNTNGGMKPFDIPYLINRIEKTLGKGMANALSPFSAHSKNCISRKGRLKQYSIAGVSCLDYLELYQKYAPKKLESYKLGFIGQYEVGLGKVDFTEYNNNLMNLYLGRYKVRGDKETLQRKDRWCRLKTILEDKYGLTLHNEVEVIDDNMLEKYEEVVDNKINSATQAGVLQKLYNVISSVVAQQSFNIFVEYNTQDSVIVSRIDKKLGYIQLAFTIAHVSSSTLDDIQGTIKPWDNMIHAYLANRGIVPPPQNYDSNDDGEEDEQYLGGYVKEPKVGRHNFVISVDLTSLYPSIIMMLNMSPEMLRCNKSDTSASAIIQEMLRGDYDTSKAHDTGWAIAANGSMYAQDEIGVIPAIMQMLFSSRKVTKGTMKDVEREVERLKGANEEHSALSERLSMLDSRQLAFKILANSGYGAIGNKYFRYYLEDIAEGITSTGQLAIRFIENEINVFLNKEFNTVGQIYSIYCDTDSDYFTLEEFVIQNIPAGTDMNSIIDRLDQYVNDIVEPFIAESYDRLAKYLNAKENRLIMKREAISDCMILRGKKNYIINVYDNEHVRYDTPQLKMMGIETARTSTPLVVRNELKECLKLVVKNDKESLRKRVKDFNTQYMQEDIRTIAFPRGVKDIEKWVDRDSILSGCPIHVRAAINYNKLITDNGLTNNYETITSGDKMRFVILRKGNPVGSHVIGFIDDVPMIDVIEPFVDRRTLFENSFLKPLESFSNLVNMDVRNAYSITDLFDSDDTDIEYVDVSKPAKVKPKKPVVAKQSNLCSLFE